MTSNMFCIICGKDAVTDTLCLDCFLQRERLIGPPDLLDIMVCPKCSCWKHANIWLEGASLADFEHGLAEWLKANASPHEEYRITDVRAISRLKDWSGEVDFEIEGMIGDQEVEAEHTIHIRCRREVCQTCSRKEGNYFEAVLQIRGDPSIMNTLAELRDRAMTAVESKKAFVSRVLDLRTGYDVYISDGMITKGIAKNMAKRFGVKVVETRSQAGHKDGHNVYRYTFLVRLPEYRDGSVVRYEASGRQETGMVTTLVPLKVRDLVTGEEHQIKRDSIGTVKVLAAPDDIRQAVLVYFDEASLQIISPSNGAAITIRKPVWLRHDPNGDPEEIEVVEFDGQWWAVPPAQG